MDSNKIDKLKELSELYKAGILSKEEVEEQKKKLFKEDPYSPISTLNTSIDKKEVVELEKLQDPKVDSVEPFVDLDTDIKINSAPYADDSKPGVLQDFIQYFTCTG